MLPLPKMPDFCSCSTVNCAFQDPSYLKASVEKLVKDNEELNKEQKMTAEKHQQELKIQADTLEEEKATISSLGDVQRRLTEAEQLLSKSGATFNLIVARINQKKNVM